MTTKTLPRHRPNKRAHESNGHAEVSAPILPPEPGDEYLPECPLRSIAANPLNPRKTFPEAGLAELAESIKAKGVIEPIIVRNHPEWNKVRYSFQLVAGERRVRAAHLAGRLVIPAIVRNLNDQQCLEIMVVENEQRADVSPLEKAAGYRALIEMGVTVEDLAQRVGKTPNTIFRLLKLLKLPELARQALADGRLVQETAEHIARVPGEKLRERVTHHVLSGTTWWDERHRLGKIPPDAEPLTSRQTKEFIRENCTVELKRAPFDRLSLDLVPQAGSCEACPQRVGNLQKADPEGYGDARADICTDPDCYDGKVKAWQAAVLREAKAAGQKVLDKKESAELFHYGGLRHNAGHYDLKEPCYGVPKKKGKTPTYGELLKEKLDPQDIAIAIDDKGELHRLVDKKTAAKHIRVSDGHKPAPMTAAQKKASAADLKQAKLERATDRALLAAIAEKGERMALGVAAALPVLRFLVANAASYWSAARDQFFTRHQISGRHGEKLKQLEDLLDSATERQLFGMLLELKIGGALLGNTGDSDGRAAAKALGIPDRATLMKQVKAQAKGQPDPDDEDEEEGDE